MERHEQTARQRTLRAWTTAHEARQEPADELLAEHELMTIAFRAIESENERLGRTGVVREEFWALAVDFVGNFMHLCHQVKEEGHLVPTLIEHGTVPHRSFDAVHREHGRERELTVSLCNAVQDIDAGRLHRMATEFLLLMHVHLQQEERLLFDLARRLPAKALVRLQDGFLAVEREVLGHKGRAYYVDLVVQMCAKTGIEVDL